MAVGGKDFENKWVLRSVRNWSRESANVLQASLEEAGWRMNVNGCKEFHKAGAEWKKERFAIAALTKLPFLMRSNPAVSLMAV